MRVCYNMVMKQETSNLEKIVSAIALLAIGVCFVVWADKVTEWIALVLGILALLAAATRTIIFCKTKPEVRTNMSLLGIILLATVGILLVFRADFIKNAISFIIGLYIIFSCSIQLMSLSSLRRKIEAPASSLAWPIIGIIIGFLCITGQFIVPDALATLTGIALIIYGIVYLLGLVTVRKVVKTTAAKTARKEITEAVIVKEAKEAEVKEKPSKKSKK